MVNTYLLKSNSMFPTNVTFLNESGERIDFNAVTETGDREHETLKGTSSVGYIHRT